LAVFLRNLTVASYWRSEWICQIDAVDRATVIIAAPYTESDYYEALK